MLPKSASAASTVPSFQALRWDLAPVCEFAGHIVSLVVLLIADGFDGTSRHAALSHARLVDGDLKKPGAELGLARNGVQWRKAFRIESCAISSASASFLTIASAAGYTRLLVRLNQAIEQIMFAALDALYQLRFVGGFGWILRQRGVIPSLKLRLQLLYWGKIFRIFLRPGKHGNEILPAV